MKTNYIFILSFLFVAILPCFGLSYNITFIGSGASTTVGSVVVQNLTTGVTATVPAGNSLVLADATAVEQVDANNEAIQICPNAADGTSTISFFAKQAGSTQLNAFSIDGKKVIGINENLQEGLNSFQISLPKGSFIIQAKGNGYSYNAKLINHSTSQSKASIVYSDNEKSASSGLQKSKSSAQGTTTMAYADGQRLLFTGNSGNFSTVLTDVPVSDGEYEFVFVDCTDGSGKHYKVVTIGTQTWMAENLKTAKFNDGTDITLGTADLWPGYTSAVYIAPTTNPEQTFYNWYAANNAKIAPLGWHVPTNTEITAFRDEVAMIVGSEIISAALAATTDWQNAADKPGCPGYDLTQNNMTGFSLFPTGYFDGVVKDGLGHVTAIWNANEWTAAEGNICALYSDYWGLYQYSTVKASGSVIRCVKNL
jgi:uncharacterized protein (TIGR02145 family)